MTVEIKNIRIVFNSIISPQSSTAMKVSYNKETFKDPQDKQKIYENFILDKNIEFCCEKFRMYCKKFSGWDYNKGKFIIVDEITYDGNSTIEISFCPFCGEEIEYGKIEASKKNKTRK